MKYTKDQSGVVSEVKGCTSCPHKVDYDEKGKKFMRCQMKIKIEEKKFSHRKKKLIGKWMGPYHESCPLPSSPQGEFQEIVK